MEFGRLLAFDEGEWGGALLWSSDDGSVWQKLVEHNVPALVRLTHTEALAVRNPERDKSVVELFIRDHEKWRAETITTVPGWTFAAAKESADTVLVLTSDGLHRVKTTGQRELLGEFGLGTVFPNSIVKLPDGVIYIGMRHFILAVRPFEFGYEETWLVPNDCRRFTVDGLDANCICRE